MPARKPKLPSLEFDRDEVFQIAYAAHGEMRKALHWADECRPGGLMNYGKPGEDENRERRYRADAASWRGIALKVILYANSRGLWSVPPEEQLAMWTASADRRDAEDAAREAELRARRRAE